MIDERMENPSDSEDITQILINSTFDGRELTQFEILNILLLFMIGGLHTVQGQLAHTVIFMAENPEVRKQLVEDLDLVPSAVEEMLRYESAVCPAREITEDTELNGVAIKAGDKILIRSEEHTSELQSLMRISYAVFCLKKQTTKQQT